MEITPDATGEVIRERIFALLDVKPRDPSPELLDLLAEYWRMTGVYFGTKMEP